MFDKYSWLNHGSILRALKRHRRMFLFKQLEEMGLGNTMSCRGSIPLQPQLGWGEGVAHNMLGGILISGIHLLEAQFRMEEFVVNVFEEQRSSLQGEDECNKMADDSSK